MPQIIYLIVAITIKLIIVALTPINKLMMLVNLEITFDRKILFELFYCLVSIFSNIIFVVGSVIYTEITYLLLISVCTSTKNPISSIESNNAINQMYHFRYP